MSGDCAYVFHGWDQGFHVTAVEWSSVAVNNLKKQFEASGVVFSQSSLSEAAGDGSIVYEAEGIRLVVADWDAYAAWALERQECYDLIFDKDVYGYFGPVKGKPYAQSVCKLLKPRGFVYLEVKNMTNNSGGGPPFHISRLDVDEAFGACGLGVVKDFGKLHDAYGPAVSQVGYMLQKAERQ